MKILVAVSSQRFTNEAAAVRKILRQLERLLHLKGKAVEVYLVGDRFMKKNVLAFPAPRDFPRPDLKPYQSLGELYLNPACIRRQGKELAAMLVHGFLHLLGYDHTINREQAVMERKEQELLRRLRPANGSN